MSQQWPTPNAHDGRRPGADLKSTQGGNLNRDAVMWMTPSVSNSQGNEYTRDRGQPGMERLTLTGQAQQWTTPRVTDTSKGGPNQEFAAAAALELADLPGVVVVGIDSDGTDGPTDYAGGVADSRTAAEAKQRGVDLFTALRRHDITPALVNIDHAILTGNTGTNVNDLKIMVIGKPS